MAWRWERAISASGYGAGVFANSAPSRMLRADRAVHNWFVVDEDSDVVTGLDRVEAKRRAREYDLAWHKSKAKLSKMVPQPFQ